MSGSSAVPILCATCGLEIVGTMWWHESDPLNRYCERCGVPSPTPAAPAGSDMQGRETRVSTETALSRGVLSESSPSDDRTPARPPYTTSRPATESNTAPAGSGWLTMTEDEYEEHIAGPMSGRTKYLGREPLRDERLLAEAIAQRARAEAAERERDEARELIVKERAGGDADREWLTTERDEARAALAASTEREAGLRKDAERWRYVRDWYTWLRRSADIGSDERGNPLTELRTYFEVRVPNGSNLSCAAMLDHAIDAAPASLAAPEGGTDG